jgi:Ca2+-binding RTX toxin-like protein
MTAQARFGPERNAELIAAGHRYRDRQPGQPKPVARFFSMTDSRSKWGFLMGVTVHKAKRFIAGVTAALLCAGLAALVAPTAAQGAPVNQGPVGNGFTVTPGDLGFILKQIKIAEHHAATLTPANPCGTLVGPGPDQIPDTLSSYGLRTVDGSCNNLAPGLENFAASDVPFPRLTTPAFGDAEAAPAGFPAQTTSSYRQKTGSVYDSEPRVISNLIDDQTDTNPAAVAAATHPVRTQNPTATAVPCVTQPTTSGGTDGVPAGCTSSGQTLFIPNVTTNVGLSPPYNSLFTYFGQFFDHGIDQTVKGGGTVFIPLRADDPLRAVGPDGVAGTGDEVPANQAFMVLTRAQNQPGPDGVLGDDPATPQDESLDDIQNASNTDTPWVDQSQTYASHASHQVFLRQYNLVGGVPVSTGKLLGALADPEPSGDEDADGAANGDSMSTWASVKRQSADKLGLLLLDKDVLNVPMIAADPYGKFIPGPHGLPQYVTKTGLVEGDLAHPVTVPSNVLYFDTPFLTDIAHNADPSPQDSDNNPATAPVTPVPDADTTASADFKAQQPGTYDDEMLNRHFICGDGRCNENIALSSIHQVFHSEHNRLVDYIDNVLRTDTSPTGLRALADWQSTGGPRDYGYNYGERLFQAARFVNEMEYQHLVFEEFARKVQPAVRPFAGYSPDINPAIEAEFAHAVYRFGHSMLDDTVARTNTAPDGTKSDNSIPLLTAFLNPPEFFDGGTAGTLTPEAAAGSIIMGSADQTGNELDEFVTQTLRNNLLGLPLDLATLNLTRAREAGVPPLNDVRRQIFAQTNDGQLAPYTSWTDFRQHLKHPESLINFVAAYGTHPTIRDSGPDGIAGNADDVTTIAGKRAAATLIVNGAVGAPADSRAFMASTGAWANVARKTVTGLDSVDLWVGGLAEVTNVFGGLLGSTFNYVFQTQLEKLQDGDRLYYLNRTPGLNLRSQLEGNSFAEIIQRNTSNTSTLNADVFATADCKFDVSHLDGTAAGYTANGATVADDPATGCNESELLLRQPDGTIQYKAINSVDPPGINGQSVYQGTAGADRIFGGNDNDTFWGGAGNDVIEGGGGDDVALGGDGNDIITDLSGADILKGGPGNDALDAGIGNDIVIGGDGQDFMNGGANDNQSFAGPGNDYIIAGQGADTVFGDGGDDWIEGGTGTDVLHGDHGAPFLDDPGETAPGNDIFIGQPGRNDYDAEGGDDIMEQNPAIDRNAGAGGFDWAAHQYDTTAHQVGPVAADDDMMINNNLSGPATQIDEHRDIWQETEADSGSPLNDIIRGDDLPRVVFGLGAFSGCDALDPAGVARIGNLDKLVTEFPSALQPIIDASAAKYCPLVGFGANAADPGSGSVWAEGNILLGGAGSDIIEGRGNNDIIDGDHELRIEISVHDATGAEIGTTDLMEHTAITGTFGPGTDDMTLQQAVFAGLVDPGNLVNVREIPMAPDTAMAIQPDNALTGDCGPSGAPTATSTNCDVAQYSTTADQYTLNHNSNGSVTVSFHAPAAAPALSAKGDGTDTLWNIEDLQFCTANDAVTTKCTAYQDVPVSSLPITSAVTAAVSPASLAFGPVLVGTASKTQTVTVTNAGSGTLNVTGALVRGRDADQFTARNNCTQIVGPGTCTVDLAVNPTSPVAKTAELDITTNASGSTQVVSLTGTGVLAASAPLDVSAARAGTGAATVSWSLPSDGGTPITGFLVDVLNGATVLRTLSVAGGSTTSATVTGLINGIPVTFRVSAVTAVGPGARSVASNAVTPATTPGAPTIGAPARGNASVTVGWTPPANNGGSAITGYEVRVLNAANAPVGPLRTAVPPAKSVLVTGLVNGATYRFQVRAVNGVAAGAYSALSVAAVPATVPAAPPIGVATAGIAGGAITATARWGNLTNNGGSAITGYQVSAQRYSNAAGTAAVGAAVVSAVQGPTIRALTMTLTAGNYRFTVKAINAVAYSAASAKSNLVTAR